MEISRIKIVREDIAIWLVYAGWRRRFFSQFRSANAVFLNLPGFDASERVFRDDDLLRQHLAMSDEIRKWVSGARNSPPARRAAAYSPNPYAGGSSEAKSFVAEIGNIERLFIQAKPGDLILSPSIGHYDPFLIGEITHPWSKDDDLIVPTLLEETVPSRKVRWLGAPLARRDFSPKVSRRLQNQHAISQVDPETYEEILGLVYPSYVWGNSSKLDVFGDNYHGRDPLQTYDSAILLKYVLASVFAFNEGKSDEFQAMSAKDAITAFYDEALVEEFGLNFNSPGKFTIIAALGCLAVLAAAGLYVGTASSDANFDQVRAEAVQLVGAAIHGDNKADSVQALGNYVNSMKATNWKEVQKELGAPSNQKMPLSLSNKVEAARHRNELNG